MGDQTEQRRWDSRLVVAGKSSETGAPDAPQQGRKLKPKVFFSVNVVLNKTHGLGGSAGMFRVFEVSTTGKSSSSLIRNTCQVLISVCFGARAAQSTCKASCLVGISGSAAARAPQTAQHAQAPGTWVPWQWRNHEPARLSPSAALRRRSTHMNN